MCKKCNLIEKYGDKIIVLSTANSYSYNKAKIKFSEYAEKYVKQQDSTIEGSSTYYWFGDNNHTEWAELFDMYNQPPYKIPKLTGALSFGVAGALTGVPFHIHGPTFAETIYGRKRWFLYPPSASPQFNPDSTTLLWILESYPKLEEAEKPLECTLKPGEILFIPDRWWHATLNLDNAVFISTFMG
ncbi:DgyrCDS1297 [Dimorphilus gyrociliatus]|nr:DgyrCDS1297 [Dimorphilus gyrociliatus]